jgi:hypothetical protein
MMSGKTRLAALVAAPLILAMGGMRDAHAALIDEVQVYTDDINAPGQFGLEMHLNTTPKGRSTPDYPGEVVPHHGWRLTPEFSYGIAPQWEAGLYLPASRDANGDTELAGAKVRLKWLPVKPAEGEAGWFFGANGELSRLKERFSQSRTSAELRIMTGWRNADWLVAANPVFGWSLSDGLRSSTADLSLGTKIARTVAPGWSLGIEYYAEAGTTSRPTLRDQAQTLYGAIDAEVAGWSINLGVGRGLTRSADKLTVKTIFGIPF